MKAGECIGLVSFVGGHSINVILTRFPWEEDIYEQ